MEQLTEKTKFALTSDHKFAEIYGKNIHNQQWEVIFLCELSTLKKIKQHGFAWCFDKGLCYDLTPTPNLRECSLPELYHQWFHKFNHLMEIGSDIEGSKKNLLWERWLAFRLEELDRVIGQKETN